MRFPAVDIQAAIVADPHLREIQQGAVQQKPVVVDAESFLQMHLPERKILLEPWLPSQGLAMVYAPRGIGKTFFSLNAAYAVASGGEFLGWKAPTPQRVLYIDGEMPANVMQQRLIDIIRQHTAEAAPDFFQIVTPDLQPLSMTPNLSSFEGQALIEPLLEDVALVVVDNISTLCRGGDENDAASWEAVQGWALRLRSRGISVLFVHHAGKSVINVAPANVKMYSIPLLNWPDPQITPQKMAPALKCILKRRAAFLVTMPSHAKQRWLQISAANQSGRGSDLKTAHLIALWS
jgi:hypothetical protein